MENYICINGKKAELTEEQMKALGIELPKANTSPFDRAKYRSKYYCIDPYGHVNNAIEANDPLDRKAFGIANYCTDKAIMEQRALHETLNRLLWRYAMENNSNTFATRYYVTYNKHTKELVVHDYTGSLVSFGEIDFSTREVAEKAIEEIVKPFMKAHPEFKF